MQHGEDRHAGYGHIKPYGQRKPGDLFVLGKASGQGEEKCDEHHGQRHGTEHDMADEDGEIHGTDGAVALVEDVSVERVVDGVDDEEERRQHESGEHGTTMRPHVAPHDEGESRDEADGGQAVQERVESGQKQEPVGKGGGRGMHVDEPEEESRCGEAESDDAGDGRLAGFVSGLGDGHNRAYYHLLAFSMRTVSSTGR